MNHHTAIAHHKAYGITQCYLPLVSGDFTPLPQPKLVLDLVTAEGCKAELTWVWCLYSKKVMYSNSAGHSGNALLNICNVASSYETDTH